jgi:hypothetical protein
MYRPLVLCERTVRTSTNLCVGIHTNHTGSAAGRKEERRGATKRLSTTSFIEKVTRFASGVTCGVSRPMQKWGVCVFFWDHTSKGLSKLAFDSCVAIE